MPWDSEFHVFAVEWRLNSSLSFFVDKHKLVILTQEDVEGRLPFEPMAWILNTALDVSQMQNVTGHCRFPLEHKVDYVRVYAL